MKKMFLALGALLSLVIAAAVPVQAQSLYVRVSVPFEFSIAGKTLPAGDYVIKGENGTGLIRVARADGEGEVAVTTSFNGGQDKAESVGSRVLFARYDNHYYMRRIFDAGRGTNRQFSETKIESEARSAAVRRDTVTLLAQR